MMMHGSSCGCHSSGSFFMGAAAGMALGAAIGAVMAPSSRQVKRAAHKAVRRVDQVVDRLTDAMTSSGRASSRRVLAMAGRDLPICWATCSWEIGRASCRERV